MRRSLVLVTLLALAWLVSGAAEPRGGCGNAPCCGGKVFPCNAPCPDYPPAPPEEGEEAPTE